MAYIIQVNQGGEPLEGATVTAGLLFSGTTGSDGRVSANGAMWMGPAAPILLHVLVETANVTKGMGPVKLVPDVAYVIDL